MKVRIVVVYEPRYRRGHRWQFVPPVTGIHLAALTPAHHEVEVVHEQVRPAPLDRGADVVALTFFSGFARRAYALADAYRRLGVKVVAGGPHVTFWPEEALQHVDVAVTGEADRLWPQVLDDLDRGAQRRLYQGQPADMAGLPTPRYDLVEPEFVVPRVIQATRGCPFRCRFCSVPGLQPGFRARPVDEVVRDVAAGGFAHRWQEKVAWFWDDNLVADRRWAKELLAAMRGLDRWWLTQASLDIARDPSLLDAMERSGCAGVFLGIESLSPESLEEAGKRQNRVGEYRRAIRALHERGFCVMGGFIAGFDSDTPQSIEAMADQLANLEIDVPFLSVLTPYRGTALWDELREENRLLEDAEWDRFNGYNVAFVPRRMSPEALLRAHRRLWAKAFSPAATLARLGRGLRQLSRGGLLLSAAMNGFYGLKGLTGNAPRATGLLVEPRPGVVGDLLERLGDRLVGLRRPPDRHQEDHRGEEHHRHGDEPEEREERAARVHEDLRARRELRGRG